MRIRGGKGIHLEWHPEDSRPIVTLTPQVKLLEGPDFAFGARWALVQYHPWLDRHHFIQMTDQAVRDYFRA